MIAALLFLISIIASSVVVIFYKTYNNSEKNITDMPAMIFWSLAPVGIIYVVLFFIGGAAFNFSDIITGLFAAIFNILSIIFLLKAMSGGEMTVSVVIINLSFCIPILLSIIFLKESASALQLIGMAILVLMIILVNLIGDKKEKHSVKGAVKVLVFAFLACITNGLINFMLKLQQFYTGYSGGGMDAFYLAMFGGGSVICAIYFFAAKFIAKSKPQNLVSVEEEKKPKISPATLIFLLGFAVGLCQIFCMYPQSLLTNYVSATVQFTITASGAVLLSVMISFIKYKEKLNLKNVVSVICCLAAIMLQLV